MLRMSTRDQHPFLGMLKSPKQTLTSLFYDARFLWAFLILWLGGISGITIISRLQNVGEETSLLTILLSVIIGGFVMGVLGWFLFSILYMFFGSLFGGRGDFSHIQIATAYSLTPLAANTILTIIPLLFLQEHFFQVQSNTLSTFSSITLLVFSIIEGVVLLWSFILTVASVSEAHRLSFGKSFLTVLFSWIIVLVILFGMLLTFNTLS
ncbi:Yip1 family protein [Priestia endophytica]|uniref:Yip1 family protein n=1 Tax=Priestia endophytica TaxID=135735 RepID=UPI0022806229|nr:Yip1 family protein [Priestia endophytica]MCY8235043.1 YIP1 family protein [Priestia endophytica]